MKSFIIFIVIVVVIYISTCVYTAKRLMQCAEGLYYRRAFFIVYITLCVLFFAERALFRIQSAAIQYIASIGTFWLAFLFYLLLGCLLFDAVRIINRIAHICPDDLLQIKKIKNIVFFIITGVTVLVVSAGAVNARFVKIRRIKINFPYSRGITRPLVFLAVSDIHLGKISGKNALTELKRHALRVQPDAILLAGDIIDENPSWLIRHRTGDLFKDIKSGHGFYACTGNHEYISGIENTADYLESLNIKLLRDTAVRIGDTGIIAVGRDDISALRFGLPKRLSLEQIFSNNSLRMDKNENKIIIVLDHQPSSLQETILSRADILICGHTHHGQLWPINFITSRIFPLSYGYRKEGNLHYLVSGGIGTWGPPVRTSARPEIIELRIYPE